MTKNERWILSEWRVARDRVERLGENLIAHREKSPFAEVDLLFETPNQINLVEVKSSRVGDYSGVTGLQERRLLRARLYYSEKYARPCAALLAFVNPAGAIEYFDFPLGC